MFQTRSPTPEPSPPPSASEPLRHVSAHYPTSAPTRTTLRELSPDRKQAEGFFLGDWSGMVDGKKDVKVTARRSHRLEDSELSGDSDWSAGSSDSARHGKERRRSSKRRDSESARTKSRRRDYSRSPRKGTDTRGYTSKEPTKLHARKGERTHSTEETVQGEGWGPSLRSEARARKEAYQKRLEFLRQQINTNHSCAL
ncbi:hypothetical protein AAMO2058_001219600 [Amorphochlora amoebiformis]